MYLPKPVKTKYHIGRWGLFLFLIILSAVALGLHEFFTDQAESSQEYTKIDSDLLNIESSE